MNKIVITYGTFDMFHIGHLNLLTRLRSLGNRLIVGVSTDEFNEIKGKKALIRYEERAEIVGALKCVDLVIPENTWEQKIDDIKKYNANLFGMGDDWVSKFDDLTQFCEVIYLPRTRSVSSSSLRTLLNDLDKTHVAKMKASLDLVSDIVDQLKFDE